MQSLKDEEFEILGLKLRFKPEPLNEDRASTVSAQEVVEHFQSEIIAIQKKSPRQLDSTQIAILVALKSVSERLELKKDFTENLGQLEKSATDALDYLSEISPVPN